MRLLIWSEKFWPYVGGVQTFLVSFCRRLRERGHAIEVITAHGELELPDQDWFEGIPVLRIDLFDALQRRDPRALFTAKRAIAATVRRFQPDLVHIHFLGPGGWLLADAVDEDTPVVMTLHASMAAGLRSAGDDTALGRMLRRVCWTTACSQTALDQFLAVAPSCAAASSVIPYATDIPLESASAAPQPVPWDPPRLLSVGRLVAMKGMDVAIDALAHLHATVPALRTVRLVVAGDGPERQHLEQRALAAGLGAMVEFRGWQSAAQVAALMADATVIVMPSREAGTEYTEGLPLVALEAAAMGRAVVGSRAGGMHEAVIDGVTGRLVSPDDPVALSEAIASVLTQRNVAEAMGDAARDRARSAFEWGGCVDAYDALFTRLGQVRVGSREETR